MAVPAHLWIYDASGSLIYGGSEVMGREGSIEIQGVSQNEYISYANLYY
ncbi:Hcp family type VI secretion system effector [Cronobacter sakazakii]|nr:hypothetical protein [Cronobacter sakazakii]